MIVVVCYCLFVDFVLCLLVCLGFCFVIGCFLFWMSCQLFVWLRCCLWFALVFTRVSFVLFGRLFVFLLCCSWFSCMFLFCLCG